MFEFQSPTNYFQQFMEPLLQQQQIANQTADTQQNAQLLAMKVAAAKQAQAQLQKYHNDVQSVVANGARPEDISALMLKYPDQHDALKDAWSNYSETERDRDTGLAASVYSALGRGDPAVALNALQDYKTALSNAGKDTSVPDQAIALIESGDPAKVKQAQGMAGLVLAQAYGPDKGPDMLKALQPDTKDGFTLKDAAGNEYRYASDGSLVAVGGFAKDGETDGSATTATTTPTDPKAAVSYVIDKNEGSYNPKDANGSPTNWGINFAANKDALARMGINASNFRNMTKDQATQLYLQKYWPDVAAANLPANAQAPYFDVMIRNPGIAKAAWAKANGDPAKFVQISNQMFQPFLKRHPEYVNSYQQRFNNNMAIANGQAGTDATQTDSSQNIPGFHSLGGTNSGQFRVLSDAEAKARGLDTGQQYQLDTKTGKITGLGQKSGTATDTLSQYGIAPDETGPSVLAKLPANLASQVKALAEGRLPMPSSFALAKPYWQTMLQLTSQYDPTFDAASAPARKAAITAFTGMGKGAQVVSSVNRVANHLQLLWNESNRLAGPDLGNSLANSAAASIGQSFEPQDAKAYDTEAQFVAGELEKIARNSPGTASGVDQIISNLSRKQSLSTRQAAIKAAVGIISGAVDPLKDQYNSAFTNGSARPNIPWVSPQAQKIYRDIGGVDLSLTGANADTNNAGGGNIVAVSSPQQAASLPSGTLFRTPDGRVLRKR